jgi:hypothetical protein
VVRLLKRPRLRAQRRHHVAELRITVWSTFPFLSTITLSELSADRAYLKVFDPSVAEA